MNFLDIFSQTTNSLAFLVFLTSFRCLARAEKTGSPFDWPEKDFHEYLTLDANGVGELVSAIFMSTVTHIG